MAGSKKLTKGELMARLTPDSVDVPINGKIVRVPANKEENTTMNAVMISQGRVMIQEAIKKWQDIDETPDPRQLKDIIFAMHKLVEASNVIYVQENEVINENKEKKAETTEPDDVSFEGLHQPPEVKEDERPERNPPEVDGS